MVIRKNLKNPVKTIRIKSEKENGQSYSLLVSAVSLLGTFGTSPVGCLGNSWRLACGSWMDSWSWHSAAPVEHLECSGVPTA